ncbi:hypothetical protein [Pseudomonas sp. CMR5c]|uniref:hypothetical protein n=1 Tax=Pseudomonas sp. CMR5c TaxID=658630 RepID=UPI00069E83EA|nr:hypothetical protein [Pseudomonas sp. CMR5c]AZC18591.1 Alpha/beta superfamily hydrolase [Pseudomonas sp. CMR5c]
MLLGLGGLARAGDPAPQHLLRPDGSSISYYLQQRQPSGPSSSLLVILQGSDCNSVSHVTSIPLLAQAMPEADVLTVEKYGLEATLPYSQDAERADCPQAYLEHDSPTQRTDDLQAVIQYLRQQRHYASVIALGGSEGAVIAHALAARPGVDFRSYPGLGHRFDDHHGQSHMPTVVDDIALWLRQLPPPGDKRG